MITNGVVQKELFFTKQKVVAGRKHSEENKWHCRAPSAH